MFFILICMPLVHVHGQSLDSLNVVEINNKKFIIHTVEKGHTLYAISKKYDTPIDVIKQYNPEVKNGLSVGQLVKIPLKRNAKQAVKDEQLAIDGNYLIHEVRKGETVYGIAKMYEITQGDLKAENPGIENGISIGQKLKIPVAKIQKKDTVATMPAVVKSMPTHLVMKGETLYGLSKKYMISVDAIKKANDGLPNGLKEGQTIYIPKKRTGIKIDTAKVSQRLEMALEKSFKPIVKKQRYEVGVLLPFYVLENKEMEEKRNAAQDPEMYPRSLPGIEFYTGLKYALDSLVSDSFRVTLKVYDTENDTVKVGKLISGGELDHLDMIIGPFYPDNFEMVARFVQDKDIKLISPVPQSNKVLLGNGNVVKVATSRVIQTRLAAAFVVDSFMDENILVIRTKKDEDKLLAKAFRQNLVDILKESGEDSSITSLKEIEWTTSRYAFGAVRDKIRADKRNLLFVPSSDLTFITDLMTKLNKDFDEHDITIIGKENWQRFDNIEVGYFHQLNVHLTTYLDVKESDTTYARLMEYMHEKKQHPTKYTLLGADIGFYFLSMLNKYGAGFEPYLEEEKSAGMISDFDFFKTGVESGYENRSSNLLRYQDFQLIKVR